MTHSKKQMNAGYTIDQTILIIAIIAILITIIIATVGWDLLQRAGGAKVASHLRQVEGAIGEFYSRHSLWPHEALNLAPSANSAGNMSAKARILNVASLGVASTGFDADDHKAAIPAYVDNANGPLHGLGTSATGYLTLRTETGAVGSSVCGRTNTNEAIYVIQMADLTLDEVIRADASLDGGDGNAAGRLRWPGAATANDTDITFCGNRF